MYLYMARDTISDTSSRTPSKQISNHPELFKILHFAPYRGKMKKKKKKEKKKKKKERSGAEQSMELQK